MTQRNIRRLVIKWGDFEAELARQFGWYDLSEEVRLHHPGQQALDDIDQEIAALADACDVHLAAVIKHQARSVGEIMLKMKVAAEVVDPVDDPDGNALIRGILRDLSNLQRQDL